MMNEAFQAKEGLPPDLFPEDIPTYTGHYHKPHMVDNSNIRYIGSPYQGLSCCPCCHPIISTLLAYMIAWLHALLCAAKVCDKYTEHLLLPLFGEFLLTLLSLFVTQGDSSM